MALSQEVQAGIARIHGIPPINSAVDELTWSIATVALTSGSGFNPSSVGWSDEFKIEEIPSADGSVIETAIASQSVRNLSIELYPSSTSGTPTRAEAEAFVTHFLTNASPLAVFILSGFKATLTWVNGTSATDGSFNYVGGGEIMLKRDVPCIMNVKLRQYRTRADGSKFAALPIAS